MYGSPTRSQTPDSVQSPVGGRAAQEPLPLGSRGRSGMWLTLCLSFLLFNMELITQLSSKGGREVQGAWCV